MQRRKFIAMLGGAVAWPFAARAQQPAMRGYLGQGSPQGFATRLAAFLRGLDEAGYREGQNVAIEYRWAEGQNARLPALAADLVRRQVTVIATPSSSEAARAAKSATTTIPIVFETGIDPIATGLVTSLNRPDGNITGVASLNSELGQKRLELLHELLPAATVIAALVNPTNPAAETLTSDLQAAARALGLEPHILHATSTRDFNTAFAAFTQLRADGLVVTPDPFFIGESKQLVELTIRHRIVTMFHSRNFVSGGSLMSYGGNVDEAHRQLGIYTGRILRGDRPADLPVQQVTRLELVLNLKTAKAFGIDVPASLLARADEVIE